MSSGPILEAVTLTRTFREGSRTLDVLGGVDVHVQPGEWLSVVGRSGSGKSTLLHLLGGLDRPTSGIVRYRGDDLYALPERRIDRYRARNVGFVFQFYHLLPELTALENALIGSMIGRSPLHWLRQRGERRARAAALLEQLGLKDRMRHRPAKLSGGERQRVAIARALMNEPDVLLADEPTGNLDAATGAAILDLFRDLHAGGQTMVLVTHDMNVAAAADRTLTLVQGVLQERDGNAAGAAEPGTATR